MSSAQDNLAPPGRWAIYFRTLRDVTQMIRVDVSLADPATRANRSTVLRVRGVLHSPNPQGLLAPEEAQAMQTISDDLCATVTAQCNARFVGRMYQKGEFEYVYYVEKSAAVDAAVRTVAARHRQYPLEFGTAFDPGWTFYDKTLYPDAVARAQIQQHHQAEDQIARQAALTRALLKMLTDAGDDLSTPREVDFNLDFKTEAGRESFSTWAQSYAYKCHPAPARDLPNTEFPFPLRMQKTIPPTFETLCAAHRLLIQKAMRSDGRYDGCGMLQRKIQPQPS